LIELVDEFEECDLEGFIVVVGMGANKVDDLAVAVCASSEDRSGAISVIPSPVKFDPDRWWEDCEGIRTEFVGLQKLFLEAVLHPSSF
jgi:hypothetical protein